MVMPGDRVVPMLVKPQKREQTLAELLEVVQRVRRYFAEHDAAGPLKDRECHHDPSEAEAWIERMRKVFAAVDDDLALVAFISTVVGEYKNAWWLVPPEARVVEVLGARPPGLTPEQLRTLGVLDDDKGGTRE
jgi:hypothetical protein